MSKQSNEVNAAADQRCESTKGLTRRDRVRPNRDEFVAAKEHADNVLGLDEKVSDGMRRALSRFKNSPLTLYMEILNDEEQPWERRLDAAREVRPFIHRKLEDKHGTTATGSSGGGAGAPAGSSGPTINLTVNRPKSQAVTINTTEREVDPPAAQPQATSAAKHEQEQQQAAARPKTFKKPKKAAK